MDRQKLVKLVKVAGQEVIDRAEDLVGEDINFLTDFDIWLRFLDDGFPTVEVTRSHLVRNAYSVMMEE